MPHKRNPIVCERVTGMARLVRSYLTPAMENMALWHERDIAHSSVERVIIPGCLHPAGLYAEEIHRRGEGDACL